jgi:hypothetical protein
MLFQFTVKPFEPTADENKTGAGGSADSISKKLSILYTLFENGAESVEKNGIKSRLAIANVLAPELNFISAGSPFHPN